MPSSVRCPEHCMMATHQISLRYSALCAIDSLILFLRKLLPHCTFIAYVRFSCQTVWLLWRLLWVITYWTIQVMIWNWLRYIKILPAVDMITLIRTNRWMLISLLIWLHRADLVIRALLPYYCTIVRDNTCLFVNVDINQLSLKNNQF